MYVQDVIQALNAFWEKQGCILWQPYHTEVGAGTSNPATFLRVLGPEPWWVAYPEPSIRPTDGRYGENPNRLQHYYQYQVILKPSPHDVQELFLQSLEALGLDLTQHDFRFVEDNWQSPSLGAWGLGWEAWLDGMEILQFTYFQECGGIKLDVRACELTYGVERIAMFLQGVKNVYDLAWAPCGITYEELFHRQEVEFCTYNFEAANTRRLFEVFETWEAEASQLVTAGLVLPAYDHCLRLSHLFNVLDARGAFSVTERGRFLLRCRSIAERCAKEYVAQREQKGFPLLRLRNLLPGEPPKALASESREFAERDTLLLEIGAEELPHNDIQSILDQGPELMHKLFEASELEHGPISIWVSPLRIAIQVGDLSARQKDALKEVRGPRATAARDADGKWTTAARKFAEANGASLSDIYFNKQGNIEYCFIRLHKRGNSLSELLPGILEQFLRGIQFTKSMGWEDATITFSRPIRWLLALHGSRPVPVALKLRDADEFGPERRLHSSNISYGHRRLTPGPIPVESAENYRAQLRERCILADREERMQALRQKVRAQSEALGLLPDSDDDLFEEICDLVEWPLPILGEIPEDALALPEPLIVTPMKTHQRYIPLRNPDGSLSKYFLAVANGPYDDGAQRTIRAGNEQVLHARLRDAQYFWEKDTRKALSHFAKGLANVMFHQKLGTMAHKVSRLKRLYGQLQHDFPTVDKEEVERVLDLMKADLITQMVGEFPSLEGVVGMLYARKEGLPEHVARALFEHRLPRRAGDELPKSPLGITAGLLDRVDTLAGYFGIGARVKGTSDPFGLRRNALAVLVVIKNAELDLDLETCVRVAVEGYGPTIDKPVETVAKVLDFFGDRLAAMARDDGYSYDRIAAALAVHRGRPLQFHRCLEALHQLDETQLQTLAEQAKRIQRIVEDPADAVDPVLLEAKELPLVELCKDSASRIRELTAQHAFPSAFLEVFRWVPTIARYFEDILVNTPEEPVRRNRHALLRETFAAITAPADFTKIEKRDVRT